MDGQNFSGLEGVLSEEIYIPNFLNMHNHEIFTDYCYETDMATYGMCFPIKLNTLDVLSYAQQFNPKIRNSLPRFTDSHLVILSAFYHGKGYLTVNEFNYLSDLKQEDLELINPDSTIFKVLIGELRAKGFEIENNYGGYFFKNNNKNCREDMIGVQTERGLPKLGYNPYSHYLFIGDDDDTGVKLTDDQILVFKKVTRGGELKEELEHTETSQLAQIRNKIRKHTEGKFSLSRYSQYNDGGVKLIRLNSKK